MRFHHWLIFLTVSASIAAVPPPSASTRDKKAVLSTPKSSSTKSGTAKVRSAKGYRRPAVAGPARQTVPTPERYKEIQEALASKGYLKSEANGVWGAESSDALRQYQTDHNLSPTGKLSAASLNSLGLGARTGTQQESHPPARDAAEPPVLPEAPHSEPVSVPQP